MANKLTDASVLGAVRALAIGQTFSRSERVAVSDGEKATLDETISRLRNQVNQAVSKIRRGSENTYRVESTVALTDDRAAFICTVAVTRFTDENVLEVDI